MKAWLSNLLTTAMANPGEIATVSIIAAAVAAHYGFHVTATELAATATAFAGAFAHKAHVSAKAASVSNETIPTSPVEKETP